MAHDTQVEVRNKKQYEYDRKHASDHMKKQVVNFAIMIFLTLVAFTATAMDNASAKFVVPIILLFAGIQVVLQLYSFMHLEDRETSHVGVIEFFMWGGMFIAFTFFVAFTTIIWW
jgi:cytochrome c oxidase subunit IV